MSTTMSWHNEEQQQPLLESQRQRSVLPTTALRGSGSGHGTPTEHELDTSSPSAAYRSNAMPAPSAGLEAKSALFVQVCGVGLVVAVWALVLASMPFPLPLFGYHPMVQSLAFLLLLQSVLTLQTTTGERPQEKTAAFRVHRLLNLLLVLPLFTIGASIMWYLHDQPGQDHFISWHGVLGTACVAWAWLQVAIGIAVTSFDGKLVGGMGRAKSIWKWHRLSGYLLLPLFVLTLYLGAVQTSWSQQSGSQPYYAAVVLLLVSIASGLALRIQMAKLPQTG